MDVSFIFGKCYYLKRWDFREKCLHLLFFFSDNGSGSGEGGEFQMLCYFETEFHLLA